MRSVAGFLRRQFTGVLAVVVVASLFFAAELHTASAQERARMAAGYGFAPLSIDLPGGYAQQSIRQVNQDYKHIDAWISSVGAGIAMNDLDGDGLPNDLCITDPRIDRVVVTPAPGRGAGRYRSFALDPGRLPMNDATAPMGCVPGDLNEDGRTDLIVYLWGRTPILYLAKPADQAKPTPLSADSYEPTELVPGANSTDGRYTGPQWNTNAAAVADLDGDGHLDIYIGNYFPPGPVLDPRAKGGVEMNHSMSHGLNGGVDYVLCWNGSRPAARAGAPAEPTFMLVNNAVPDDASRGWALGVAADDLDGDLLPELYLAHDFGPDRLLHNQSTPGHLAFSETEGDRTPMTPKSKRVGVDSFKGMGVDFGDLNHDGVDDMFVSNITTSFGIEESNFAYLSRENNLGNLHSELDKGRAPWVDDSGPLQLAWSGWGWDVKMADFNNSGDLAIAQAVGFVKGEINRWPQLQELATANDQLLDNPRWWPVVTKGDDVGGGQAMHFFAKRKDGGYADLAPALGLDVPIPSRGIAVGDADGDGRLDLAVARQWGDPVFYRNTAPSTGAYLALTLELAGGSPAVGAKVTVETSTGRTFTGHVDGGGGHSGKRSTDVHLGLGQGVQGPQQVRLQWRDRDGQVHDQTLRLTPGEHTIMLGTSATEKVI